MIAVKYYDESIDSLSYSLIISPYKNESYGNSLMFGYLGDDDMVS